MNILAHVIATDAYTTDTIVVATNIKSFPITNFNAEFNISFAAA